MDFLPNISKAMVIREGMIDQRQINCINLIKHVCHFLTHFQQYYFDIQFVNSGVKTKNQDISLEVGHYAQEELNLSTNLFGSFNGGGVGSLCGGGVTGLFRISSSISFSFCHSLTDSATYSR